MEHKDERLLAAEGADWRDKLAELRAEFDDGDDTQIEAPPPGETP